MTRRLILSVFAIGLIAVLGCGTKSPQEEAIADQIRNLKVLDYDEYRETITKLAEFGEPAVGLLIKGLKNGDAGVRCGCAEALGRIGDARAVEPLIKRLGDRGQYEVREGWKLIYAQTMATSCAKALGNIGDARAVEPLIELLTDRDPSHREAAMCALGKIGDERAIGPLIERTNDRYQGLSEIAGDVLNQLTGVNYYDDYERWKQWYREEYRPEPIASTSAD
jgi:HEAT repeat protein